ncbi:hypothetical protein CYMTET_12901 [Cymbomonas tetramitiformis]|uniref:Uncharacterized protein n=1 Tax=Cymbomonas tetramitiformis TaxID=36881 RepID=A0AAE0GJS2_9CHLO|nr:hypothetical protein CYMTET_12901 [Cymbomonas tetramitiformis]
MWHVGIQVRRRAPVGEVTAAVCLRLAPGCTTREVHRMYQFRVGSYGANEDTTTDCGPLDTLTVRSTLVTYGTNGIPVPHTGGEPQSEEEEQPEEEEQSEDGENQAGRTEARGVREKDDLQSSPARKKKRMNDLI